MKQRTVYCIFIVFFILTNISFAGTRSSKVEPKHKPQSPLEQLPPEKRTLFETLLQAHVQETLPLKDKMWQRQMELQALSVNPNTKPETLTAIIAEMADIRIQLRTKRDDFDARVEKEVGLPKPHPDRGIHSLGELDRPCPPQMRHFEMPIDVEPGI